MDRVSDRERSIRDREKERDHHRGRDRDRDSKHRHRGSEKYDDEKRRGSKDEKHRDGERHHRSKEDSPEPVDRHRGSKDDRHRDGERHHRSKADSSEPVERSRDDGDRHRRSRPSKAESPEDLKHGDDRDRHHSSIASKAEAPGGRLTREDDKHRDGERHSSEPVERSRDRPRRSRLSKAESPEDPKGGGDKDRHHSSIASKAEPLGGLVPRERSADRGDRSSSELPIDRHHHSSRKRKADDESEEEDLDRGKRARASDGKREEGREKRRFADRAVEGTDGRNGTYGDDRSKERAAKVKEEENRAKKEEFDDEDEARKSRREKRKFTDGAKAEDWRPADEARLVVKGEAREDQRHGDWVKEEQQSGSDAKVVQGSSNSAASSHFSTKVSSVTTTNENQGVTNENQVPGKPSTLDALAKAKKALQMQRELQEKLKKIPMLKKPDSRGVPSIASGPSTSVQPQPVSFSQKLSVEEATPETLPAATVQNYEAVKRAQELAAKMGFRQDQDSFTPLINMFPGPSGADASVPQKPSKVPVLRLDAQGREIDEHGNVINVPKLTNLSTLKVNINKQKKEAFQLLRPELDADIDSNPYFDPDMGINRAKLLRPKRMSFQFVEEGRWSKQAEIIKFKNQFGEAQAKELRTKQSQLAKAKTEVDNPNLIELPDRFERAPREKKKDPIPDIEWWDKPLLQSGGYTDVANERLNMDKLTIYVEHPRPIEPPAEPAPPPPQPLKLTKKEQKKLRTQRRLAKERDRQEMIRQGLIEPPKPKVKMSNLMKVLGSEATQDPTRLEMEIRSAAAEREQAHIDRNVARKLTPEERREKKAKKLFDDPNTVETLVSVYKINDLSDPKTRFKVDVNAQENQLSGVAVMSDGLTVVVVEGVKKSIKRYGNLMLKRIKWADAVGDNEGDEDADNPGPVNSCFLVWQGSVAKPSFYRFTVQQCRTEAAAKKVFADAGVPHYWDLAVNFSEELL